MKKFSFYKIIIAGIIFLVSCSSDSKEKFTKTYAEILVAREKFPDTTRGNPEIRKILQRNNYSKEEFREDFQKFSSNTDEMRAVMDSAQAKAQRQIEAGK